MNKTPYKLTNLMFEKASSISEKLGNINSFGLLNKMPRLRKNNKIRSVHSSLVIEANSLSLDDVYDVLNGRNVIGPTKEIQEVKNAFEAYEKINSFNPYSESDLLNAHFLLTKDICEDAGCYRRHGEGVFDGDKIIFMAPDQSMVPTLMSDLFKWLKDDSSTPVMIKSCIFHYEFVFIHPFSDGNGRCARLWQNVILSKWNPIFEYLPIESQIQKYQADYYNSINTCNTMGESTVFIEFMLKVIDEALDELISNINKELSSISKQVEKLVSIMERDFPISANEIMEKLSIKSKETLRNSYLNPAIENGLIKMTIPDKPNSKNQKYILNR